MKKLLLSSALGILQVASAADFSAEERRLGGDGSVVMTDSNAFSLVQRNATPEHRRSFMVGNSLFKENWVASPATVKTRQGLGPLFNAQSCSSCHFKDGRAAPPSGPDEQFVGLLMRLSVPGKDKHGAPIPVPRYGDQLQHRAIVGAVAEGDIRVRYEEIKDKYPDGTPYSLLRPSYEFRDLKWGAMPADVRVSPRIAPHLVGLGLLEAIKESDILKNPAGKPNYVWDYKQNKRVLGRFGWKGNQPTVEQQVAGALLGDMGITSPLFSKQNCEAQDKNCLEAPALPHEEIRARELSHLVVYSLLLAVPERRNVEDSEVKLGSQVFRQLSCQSCHVESYVTGDVRGFPEVSKQKIHPFTDLRVHDMGPHLADDREDFEASGREWRTPPLWGIGLTKAVNGHTRFMHDGRARSLEEAVLWHGGDAEPSKQAFMNLKKSDRQALVKFLESL